MADVVSRGDLFSPCGKASILTVSSKKRGGPCSVGFPRCSSSSPPFKTLRSSLSIGTGFHGRKFVVEGSRWRPVKGKASSSIQMALMIGKAMKWWVKGIQPNMREIESAQDLVDSLANAGDKLVVVDFFSPGCAGCRALHPKICQIAQMNPDVQFLQINYEEHKSMCYSLNVHVLPFFRFYRGAQGRVCSFSCTNATIKKFKDALAKYNTDGCSLGVPAKGLEEKELVALAANKELGFTYTPKPEPVSPPDVTAEPALPAPAEPKFPALPVTRVSQGADKALTALGI